MDSNSVATQKMDIHVERNDGTQRATNVFKMIHFSKWNLHPSSIYTSSMMNDLGIGVNCVIVLTTLFADTKVNAFPNRLLRRVLVTPFDGSHKTCSLIPYLCH